MQISLVSVMAANADFLYRGLAGYLSRRAGVPVEAVQQPCWRERERMLDRGEAGICFICGLGYVRRAHWADLELLAAPVMSAPRYGQRPVYFSDVVVRRDSPYQSFSDLRGAAWAYNEPNSHSGYTTGRYYLACRGERSGYFRRVVEAGSHQQALRLVSAGEADAASIDSTVLELELERTPELAAGLRVIHTVGPSPIPPAVISRTIPAPLRELLRGALLTVHEDPAGRELLASARLARFTAVNDRDYDPLRRMTELAETVSLGPVPSGSRLRRSALPDRPVARR